MPYSSRQVHCMQAMGLVPWVSSLELNNPLQLAQTAPQQTLDAVEAKAENTSRLPAQLDQISPWILDQSICKLGGQGKPTYVLGAADAPLLVAVVTHHAELTSAVGNQSSLFSADAARLFDLMLASINLNRNQISLCQIDHRSSTDSSGSAVSTLFNYPRKALLLVIKSDHDLFESSAVEHHKGLLEHHALPFWRIPHPDRLLQQGHLKRQAWNVLKDVHQVLSL